MEQVLPSRVITGESTAVGTSREDFGDLTWPFGNDGDTFGPEEVDLGILLVKEESLRSADYVSLPVDVFVTLDFSATPIFDGPGADIYVGERGGGQERARVEVSTSATGNDFVAFDQLAGDAAETGFDLSDLGGQLLAPVQRVRITGLGPDENGLSPGFDLTHVAADAAIPNVAPVAMDVVRATTDDADVTLMVADLGSDFDGDSLQLSIINQASGGTATVSDDGMSITYDPEIGFSGADVFEFAIEDPLGLSDTGLVTINVTPSTTAPDFVLVGDPVADATSWQGSDIVGVSQIVSNNGTVAGPDVSVAFALAVSRDGAILLPFDGFRPDDAAPPTPETVMPEAASDTGTDGAVTFTDSFSVEKYFDRGLRPGVFFLEAQLVPEDADETVANNRALSDEMIMISAGAIQFLDELDDAITEYRGSELGDLIFGALTGRRIEGDEGQDTRHVTAPRSDAEIAIVSLTGGIVPLSASLDEDEGVLVTDIATGAQDLHVGIEVISFEDGAYLFDLPGDDVPFTYRLYSAAFARTPDERGLRFWNDVRSDGLGYRAMAGAFVDSPEFAEKFGADPTDEEFIAALYANVLLREPDAGGEAFWLDAFASGRLDRSDMLLAFSDSAENMERNEENYDVGVWVV